jgi:hypothetical protein
MGWTDSHLVCLASFHPFIVVAFQSICEVLSIVLGLSDTTVDLCGPCKLPECTPCTPFCLGDGRPARLLLVVAPRLISFPFRLGSVSTRHPNLPRIRLVQLQPHLR